MNKIYLRLNFFFLLISCFHLSLWGQPFIDDGNLYLGNDSQGSYTYRIPEATNFNAIEFTIKGGDGGWATTAIFRCKADGGEGATVTGTLVIGDNLSVGQLPVSTELRVITAGYGWWQDGFGAQVVGGGGGGSAILARLPGASDWILLAVAGGGGGGAAAESPFGCASTRHGVGGLSNIGAALSGGAQGTSNSLIVSGGGGGAFGDGEGIGDSGGKAGDLVDALISLGGFPDDSQSLIQNSGSYGGDGFGGGGAGMSGGGGGGGYSGGGGGGLVGRGGGGGSYANATYVKDKEITAGGTSGDANDGYFEYQFKDFCTVEWTGTEQYRDYEYVGDDFICNETDRGTIQMLYDYPVSGNSCEADFAWTIFPNNNYISEGPGRWSNVGVGLHLIQVLNTKRNNEVVARTEIQVRPTNNRPTARCKDVTVQLAGTRYVVGELSPNEFIDDGSTGSLCDESITMTTFPNTFLCQDIGENLVTLTVTGSNGYSSTCEATVTVETSTQSLAKCKSGYDFDLLGRQSATIQVPDIDDGSSLSSCNGQELDLLVFPSTTINDFNVGETRTAILSIKDEEGNFVSTCQTTIGIIDSGTPSLICQDPVTVVLDNTGNATLDYANIPAQSSNIPADWTYILSPNLGNFDCSDVGEYEANLRVWQYEDEVTNVLFGGFELSCSTTIKVEPGSSCTQAPQINCPNSVPGFTSVYPGQCDIPVSFEATETVGNPASVITYSHAPGSLFPVGTTTVTATATNSAGESECTFDVEVLDNEAPTPICQDITVQLDANGSAAITATQVDNGSNDACGIANLSLDQTSFDCDDVGSSNTVTLTVTDNNGLVRACQANITVEDNTAPNALCQNTTVQLDKDGIASTSVLDINNGSTDACGITNLSLDISNFGCQDLGTKTIKLTVTDQAGNASSCNAQVTIEDNIAPVLNCVDPGVVTTLITGQETASFAQFKAQIIQSMKLSDNCFLADFEFVGSFTVGCEDIGVIERKFIAIDESGNTSECIYPVTVVDQSKPNMFCQDLTVSLDATGKAVISPDQVDNGSYDYCTDISLSLDQSQFDCSHIGKNNIVTLYATDEYENTGQCQADITVEDNAEPTAICQDVTVQLDASEQAFVTPEQIAGTSTDNCGSLEFSILDGLDLFDCSSVGNSYNVLIEVKDAANNVDYCNASVTVTDPNNYCNQAPIAVCQDVTVSTGDDCQATIMVDQIDGGSYDPDGVLLLFNVNDEGPFVVGEQVLTLTVSDGQLSSTCSATVTVEDNTAPVASCQDLTIQLDDNGLGTITVEAVDNGSNDACGIADLSLDQTSFDCDEVGINIVILTATDNNGLMSFCPAKITVEDNTEPTAICQDITLLLTADTHTGSGTILNPIQIDNGSNDICGIANLSLDKTSFDCTNVGDNTVTLTATDINNNSSTCTATVTILDEIAPTLTCPQDLSVNTDQGECGAYVTLPKAAPADNCGIKNLKSRYRTLDEQGNPVGTWSAWEGDHSGFFELGTYQIQWRAKDDSNNKGFCSFQLDIIDEEAPEVICTDLTVNFNGEESIAISSASIFDESASFDACGAVSFVSQSLTEASCLDVGETLTIQVVGIDPNGNTSTCTSQVTVVGMPCGFEATDIDCPAGAEATYDPVAESYTLTANDCEGYPDGEFSTVMTELCGDGEIVAKVASLIGDGRAGVIMMESDDPGARFVSKIKDLTPRTRTEYRATTGGSISNKRKNRTGIKWVRIVRQGSKFKTYTSTNGSYWRLSHTINFSNFADCIQVGMLVYTKNANEPVTATFTNVKVTGNSYSALEQVPGGPATIANTSTSQQTPKNQLANVGLSVAPNPFADQTQIEFTLPTASEVTLEVYNLHGQRVQSLESARLDAGSHRYEWDGQSSRGESLPTGIYMLRLRADKKWITAKVSLVNR